MKKITSTNQKIIIDLFNKILISYIPKNALLKCCRFCIFRRFINTRKDRKIIKNISYKEIDSSSIFSSIVNELINYLKNDKQLVDDKFRRKVFIVDKKTLSIDVSYCLAVPDCPFCSTLPKDSMNLAEKNGKCILNNLNQAGMPYRFRSSRYWDKILENTVLDKNLGIITTLLDYKEKYFNNAVAILPLLDGRDEPGTGRTGRLESSRGIALLEAMERYAGFYPKGKETTVYESYNQLLKKVSKKHILSIDKYILNQDSIIPKKSNIFNFDKKQKYHWIWGYDIVNRCPRLIPETLAYYGMTLKNSTYKKEIIAYEISNGCSTGSSLLEASYYSLLEVIERDSFLTYWYMPHRIDKIDIINLKDKKLQSDINIFFEEYPDFALSFYNISNDTRVPVILCTIKRKKVKKDKMNFMCAASANFNVYKAMFNSLHEITSIFNGLQKKFTSNINSIKAKYTNLNNIEKMEDNSLAYGYYQNLKYINFENNVARMVTPEALTTKLDEEGLCQQFKFIINTFRKQNREVIIVDQTTEEMNKINLFCTKVLVSGLLPMTFGAKNARISNLRKEDITNYFKENITVKYLPHPFP